MFLGVKTLLCFAFVGNQIDGLNSLASLDLFHKTTNPKRFVIGVSNSGAFGLNQKEYYGSPYL